MSLIFSMDTTSRTCSLSVCKDEELLAEYDFSSGKPLSSALIPNIDFVLKNLNLKISDIDLFGVTVGPGLFTGIRVGLSTLKGLLYGKKTPVVAVSSLEAIAWKLKEKEGEIIALIDARRREVYMSKFISNPKGGAIREKSIPALINIDELSSVLSPGVNYLFAGSGSDFHKDYIRGFFNNSDFESIRPYLAYEVSQLALMKYREGSYREGAEDILPLYIRKPDAEKNLR